MTPLSGDGRSRPTLDGVIALALMAAVFAVFWAVRLHDFVDLDDFIYVRDNHLVHGGLTLESIRAAFTTTWAAYWIPLTWISLAADATLYGIQAGPMLLENVALHAASSAILYFALSRMTGRRAPSAFVAALFAIHPLHVESVAWVSERKDCLSGFFFMLALHAWAVYAEGPATWRRRMPATGWFALGLLAKPGIFPLPFALLALDAWPLGRLGRAGAPFALDGARVRAALIEKLPMFALGAAAAFVVIQTQRAGGGMETSSVVALPVRLAVSAESWGFYLAKTVWPSGLAALYPMPFEAPPAWRWAGSLALMAALTLIALRGAHARPWRLAGWAWFVIILLPVSGLLHVGVQARADRWMYLPMIGLGMAIAWEADARLRGNLARGAGAVAALAMLVALALAARTQVGWWKNSETLFTRARAVTAENHYVEDRLAQEYRRRGMTEPAIAHHLETIRIVPGWARPQVQLAEIWEFQGDPAAAGALRHNARHVTWTDPDAARKTGLALLAGGRAREAIPLLEKALLRSPQDAAARESLAVARARESARRPW